MSAWVQKNPFPTALMIVAALIVAGLALRPKDAEEASPEDITAASIPEAVADTTTTSQRSTRDPNRPDLPQLSCGALLTDDEVDEVLFDGATGARGMFTFSRGETCRYETSDESGSFVQIEPGDPSDFQDGARFDSAVGQRVDGVGEAARWFDNGSSGTGVLSVGTTVEVGALIYRIHIGRTDLDGPERLERALQLALTALPRFPFVVVEEPEPDVVTFADEPAELPPSSLDEILYDRIDAGEWTLGDGLTTMLQWMIDDTSEARVGEPIERSGSGVIAEAQAYVASGATTADDVEVLLDQLLPTAEELDARVIDPESLATLLTVSLVDFAQEDQEGVETCIPDATNPCYVKFGIDESQALEPGKYEVYVAQPSKWTAADVAVAQQALLDSVVVFEAIASMPPTRLVLNPGDAVHAGYVQSVGDCHAEVGDFLAGTDPNRLRQIFARELAFCSIAFDLFPQLYQNPKPIRWLVFGLANYMSGVVYPNANLEHEKLPGQLAQQELSTTMPARTWTNWVFFEHLHGFIGPDGIIETLRALPESADLVASLSAAPGVPELYHDLERALSDANVSDIGPGTVPYDPPAWDLPISGPAEVPVTVPQFGVRRVHIMVQPGKYACVDSFSQGAVRMSWRPGAPGAPGSWSDDLPVSFEGEAVIVLSSVESGANYTLDVTAVEDTPDCEEEEAEPDASGPVEDLCLEFCDPSTYYWGPMRFEN
jgi:hypothetical protein